MNSTIEEKALDIIASVALQCDGANGFGTLSPTVYDTAWVAMIEKQEDGKVRYLFPESFEFLKSTQSPDGSWVSNGCEVDSIINTLAAVLALKCRKGQNGYPEPGSASRSDRGEKVLREMLNRWNIRKTDRVGFEILVPKLVRLLEKEGVPEFTFPGRDLLMSLTDKKLSRLRPALMGPIQTTLIHSLEGFVGDFNFDQVKHHRMPNGSMFGSPSSTAAYLMNSTTWDHDSEHYLRGILEAKSSGGPVGAFPSAFPTTIFETVWVLSVLLESGFSVQYFATEDIKKIRSFLRRRLEEQGGLVGFAPFGLPDADDTAKAISTLIMLGEDPRIEPMLAAFEGESYFLTYHGERNPSLSANCNVLSCLLRSPNRFVYTKQILKCVNYISDSWLSGNVQDKWNISSHYPMMLITQSLVQFLTRLQNNELQEDLIPENLLRWEIPHVLLDIFIRTAASQLSDGSWDLKCEVTAYSVLTLEPFLLLQWPKSLEAKAISSMDRGKVYLNQNQQLWTQGSYLWIEKVVFASTNLSQAYCLAASKVRIPNFHLTMNQICCQSQEKMAKFKNFFTTIPLFLDMPCWNLDSSLLQSFQLIPLLKECGADIFPPMKMTSDEKYLDYIPFTWIGCKNQSLTQVPTDEIWEMMVISKLNFQVDTYVETVLEQLYRNNLEALKAVVHRICEPQSLKNGLPLQDRFEKKLPGCSHKILNNLELEQGAECLSSDHSSGIRMDSNHSEAELAPLFRDAENVLEKYCAHVLQHPKVLQSHPRLQLWLRYELKTFLLAHIAQIEDCESISKDTDTTSAVSTLKSPRSTYYNWAQSTGANHTSCPYSFVFYLCLVSNPKMDWIASAPQRYVLEDACHHLAAMCRQYNDFGSVARDRQEQNLNSINFPEFQKYSEEESSGLKEIENSRKKDLLQIAEYERRCLGAVFLQLERDLDADLISKLKLFIDVTDLYGQIYVAKDIGIRKV